MTSTLSTSMTQVSSVWRGESVHELRFPYRCLLTNRFRFSADQSQVQRRLFGPLMKKLLRLLSLVNVYNDRSADGREAFRR
jgi:hypothetical protein